MATSVEHPYIWFNGDLVTPDAARVPFLSHALHYGSGVFEGERAYSGKIFKLAEHSQRLLDSARMLDIAVPYSAQEISDACDAVVAANGHPTCYVRPLVWRGTGGMGVNGTHAQINVAIATLEMGNYFPSQGVTLQTSPWRRPPPESAPVHAKATGIYVICTLARHQAGAAGFDDALLLDTRGYIAESTGANIFFWIDDALHTPLADCFLNGITRQTVIALARSEGISVIERHILPEELAQASQVFLTGTAAEVTPVRQIDAHTYNPGAVTAKLTELYRNLVAG